MKSTEIQVRNYVVDDNEDATHLSPEKEKTEKKVTKKKKSRKNADLNNNPEHIVSIEFILNDFKDLKLLKNYKSLKSLTLICQNIKSIKVDTSLLKVRIL